MAIDYSAVKHTKCNPGNLIAQDYGEHLVSIDISGEENGIDNGRIVHIKGMKAFDLFEMEAASNQVTGTILMESPTDLGMWLVVIDSVADDKTALVYQKPLIYEESPYELTDEANYYNAKEDGPVRGYILHTFDRFWLSENGFSGTPTAGATFTTVTGGKIVIG